MTGPVTNGPAAEVDALVAAVAPGLAGPARRRRTVVLVTGPLLAGVSAVAATLRDRLVDQVVVEDLMDGDIPAVVVFVVSAAAALTKSDCALLDAAAARTDAVIGAVSKIDRHRHWPQMLQIATDALTAYAPRYCTVSWVAVAAAPEVGEPHIDALVSELGRQLLDPTVERRNQLREWEFQLQATARRYRCDAAAAGRQAKIAELHEQRDTVLRQQRLAKSARAAALRSRIAQARVQLIHLARNRCSSVRAELHDRVARLTRRRLVDFETYAVNRIAKVIVEMDQAAAAYLAEAADQLGISLDPSLAGPKLPPASTIRPVLKSPRLETQLILLLGGGFGLGVALTLSRLFADLPAGLTAAGAVAAATAGLAATVWVVRARGLLRDRAVLDRWVAELTVGARGAAEELVALRVLSAETALTAALAEWNEADGARAANQVAGLDSELRRHASAVARAAARRDQALWTLHRALAAVRAEREKFG